MTEFGSGQSYSVIQGTYFCTFTDVNTVIEMLIKTNQYLLKEIEKKKDK